MLHYPVFWG